MHALTLTDTEAASHRTLSAMLTLVCSDHAQKVVHSLSSHHTFVSPTYSSLGCVQTTLSKVVHSRSLGCVQTTLSKVVHSLSSHHTFVSLTYSSLGCVQTTLSKVVHSLSSHHTFVSPTYSSLGCVQTTLSSWSVQ